MLDVRRLNDLPPNFGAYVAEVAAGFETLYGARAAEHYRSNAWVQVRGTIAHPSVHAAAAWDGPTAAGLVLAADQDRIGRISFIHVLEAYQGRNIEGLLAREAVAALDTAGKEGVIFDCVPLCRLDVGPAFRALGFEHIERLLMAAPAHAPGLALNPAGLASRPYRPEEYPAVAEVIAAAYANHPDQRLHVETRGAHQAAVFVADAARGGCGPTHPEFGRVLCIEDRPAGVIIGCCAAPDVGLVIHVAVHPAYRNRGIGARLVQELASCFHNAGLDRIMLSVTAANPARRLYERLGFRAARTVDAYARWRGNGRIE